MPDFSKLRGLNPKKSSKTFRTDQSVKDSAELRRIVGLPYRPHRTKEEVIQLAADLTTYYRRPGGTMALRQIQALTLADLFDTRGLLGTLRVGAGKTGVTALAPTVLGISNAVLFVPAALIDKTNNDFREWEKHFYIDHLPRVLSYEWLSRVSAEGFFEQVKPQLVIADETHRLKNPKAACTRRVARYFYKSKSKTPNPDAIFIGVSGTTTKRSLKDFKHLAEWSTRHSGWLPIPSTYNDLQEWCGAVDEKLDPHQRYTPGALERLYNDAELASVQGTVADAIHAKAARSAVARRIHETPGFISTYDDVVPIALTIEIERPRPSRTVAKALQQLWETWTTPTGLECTSPVELWRHEREIALGFCYEWLHPAPIAWLEARSAWSRAVRNMLKKYSLKLDSPLAIQQAIERGDVQDSEIVDACYNWQAIRDTFKPITIPRWFCDEAIEAIAKEGVDGQLVWIEHRAIGERLAKDFGYAYHSQQSLDQFGKSLESKTPKQKLALSIASCGTGRNLQAWARNYVVTPLAQGAAWEQLIGRTHRDGQEADEVNVIVRIACAQNDADFAQARADAQYLESVQGQPQKLLLATYAGLAAA